MQTVPQLKKDIPAPPAVTVTIERGDTPETAFRFTHEFTIGRSKKCAIILDDAYVSLIHAEVEFKDGRWWIRDLGSRNGTFKDGRRIKHIPIAERTRIVLGAAGPRLLLEVENESLSERGGETALPSVSQYEKHYFDHSQSTTAGAHTQLIRKAYQRVRQKHSKKYYKIIAVVGLLFLGALVYAIYKHEEVGKQKALARDVFDDVKELELAYAGVMRQIARLSDSGILAQLDEYRKKRKALITNYDRLINELGIYDGMSEEEQLIYRVARTFGESEITIPQEFVDEVRVYIRLWKSSSRLKNAIQRSRDNGYATTIAEALSKHELPPHFFYLALQESDFDSSTCGPPTRFGIAKGMWQFIPVTAIQYGLRTGPLANLARPDPRDERHNVKKSADAAASYIRDIYDTEAQASGLLVLASYNWGHNLVRDLIRKMPENPRERNFWKFLQVYRERIPKQTYDYVFYIFSAAVIGENPRLFGFDLDSPLVGIEKRPAS